MIPWQGRGSRWPGWTECGHTAAWGAWCHFANCSGIWKRPARCPGRAASRAPWRTVAQAGRQRRNKRGAHYNKENASRHGGAPIVTNEPTSQLWPLILDKICLGELCGVEGIGQFVREASPSPGCNRWQGSLCRPGPALAWLPSSSGAPWRRTTKCSCKKKQTKKKQGGRWQTKDRREREGSGRERFRLDWQ